LYNAANDKPPFHPMSSYAVTLLASLLANALAYFTLYAIRGFSKDVVGIMIRSSHAYRLSACAATL
jgi:hypothetical protein